MSAADDLGDVLRAGASLTRLRVLRVVCPHDRTLVDVLRVNRREIVVCRVAVLRERVREHWRQYDPEPTVTTEPVGLRHGTHQHIAYLDEIEPGAWITAATSSCCARRVDFDWLNQQLGANARRVMLPPTD